MQKDQDSIRQSSQEYKHALNATVEGYDGRTFSVQNDSSNLLSIKLSEGQQVIGNVYIPSLEKTILFTTDSKGSDNISMFDTIYYDDSHLNFTAICGSEEAVPLEQVIQKPFVKVKTLTAGNFNWSINNKVNIKYKITDCSLNLYFVDGVNPDRFIYFNLDDYSLVDDFKQVNPASIGTCSTEHYNILDVNKTALNQSVTVPTIALTSEVGGTLPEGVYQVFTAYSTSKGIPLSSYNGSGTFPIFEKIEKQIEGKEYLTNQAIKIELKDVTVSSYYKYLNIIVSRTVNGVTSYKSVATIPISNSMSYIYADDNNSVSKSELDITAKYPYYEHSNVIEVSNNYLFKAGVSEYSKINIQRIANQIELEAITIKVDEEFYKKPENNYKYKSLIRDEVYAYGFELIMTEGEVTGVGHIPGRKPNNFDLSNAQNTGDIVNGNLNWQVNNTAYKTSSPHNNILWETFDFGYWESSEKYPNNSEIWGNLCGKSIRHHKTPDCSISHIHDGDSLNVVGSYNRNVSLFPMGVRIKNESQINNILNKAVTDGIISQKDRNRIVGYRLVRANRAGNKSIVAKGMLYDVWNYEKPAIYNENDTCAAKTKYYFPNIGFNDLRADPFLAKNSEHYKYDNFDKGIQKPNLLEFENTGKYTFYSPDTSYAQPTLGNILKLETEEYGESKGFFNVAENQAEYKLLTFHHYTVAILIAKFIAANTTHESANATGTGQAIGSSLGSIVGSAIPGVGTAIGGVVGGLVGSLAGGKDDVTSALQRNSIILFQTEKILQLFKNLADYEKLQYQYQAVGKYKAFKTVQNNNKQRLINNSAYLSPTKQTVGQIFINNTFRESSVYLDVNRFLPSCSIQDTSKNKLTDSVNTNSSNICKKYQVVIDGTAAPLIAGAIFSPPIALAFQDCQGIAQKWDVGRPETRTMIASIPPSTATGITVTEIVCPECKTMTYIVKDCSCKGQEITNTISSYYASVKTNKINQYGGIFNIQYLNVTDGVTKLTDSGKLYFGGDTFITPHVFKRKHSYFNNTSFGLPDDTDMFYQDLGNVAYPTYFFNTKENNKNIKPSTSLLFDLLQFGNYANSSYDFISNLFGFNNDFTKATNILDNFSLFAFDPTMWIKAPNFYLDCYDNNIKSKPLGLFSLAGVRGIMYLYNYAIPYFYCESDINTFYRNSKNEKEYDFYPHQSDLNYWLQEKNVPIRNDNFYFYNRDYSKQNKEGFHYSNDINFDPTKSCKTNYPNRVIYSLQSSELDNSDVRDNYLINRALDYYDFSQINGKLTGIHGIESDKVLITFENNTQIFSAYNTMETEQGTVQIGNGGIFRSKPQEFSKTALGYLGSQHTAFLSTEFGHLLVDAKRGQVFLLGVNGTGATELTKDRMRSWFKNNLPFNINKFYNVNIDNTYAGIGMTLCFDKRYNRFFITKLDYEPIDKTIVYRNNKFYSGTKEVKLTDRKYFYNKSWTVSYNLATNSWTSFHSFTPNYYIENTSYFMSGLNNNGTIWSHNLTNKSYQVYYGIKYPFEVEMLDKYEPTTKTVQSISYILDSFRYHNKSDVYSLETVGFNKAIIYNDTQCSGLLALDITNNKDLFTNKKYPILEDGFTKVLQVNKENRFSFNQFKNRISNKNIPMFLESKNGVDKKINTLSLDLNKLSANFDPIRNNINYVKLIQDKYSNYKFVFKLADFTQNYSMR